MTTIDKNYCAPACIVFNVHMPETILAGSYGNEDFKVSPIDPWVEED